MAHPKFDILIETVRYAPDGSIQLARVFKRRGPAYSDHSLMTREKLLEALRSGVTCVTGQRKEFLAGSFDVHKTVQMVGQFISTAQSTNCDHLENVPIF